MQIHVSMSHDIRGEEHLVHRLEVDLGTELDRFKDEITHVEVRLSDESAETSGGVDRRCVIEARPVGRNSMAVTDHGATIEEAFKGAVKKLRRRLESVEGRWHVQKSGASIRTDEGIP